MTHLPGCWYCCATRVTTDEGRRLNNLGVPLAHPFDLVNLMFQKASLLKFAQVLQSILSKFCSLAGTYILMTEKHRSNKPDHSDDHSVRQQAASTQGSNYQAGRDIHFHQASEKPADKTRWLGTTQSVVIIISTLILIGIALFFTIPDNLHKRAEQQPTDSSKIIPSILVTGIIKAKATGGGISDAYITCDLNYRDTIRTTTDGTFQLQVRGAAGQPIRIYVWAARYKPRNEIHTLGSPVEIQLDRQ